MSKSISPFGETVWHEHFFPDDADIEGDDITGRYDAVETADGSIYVWNVEAEKVVAKVGTREGACEMAATLANMGVK